MKKGFTLVEIIVVIGVFGVLMVAGTEILIAVIKAQNRASIENEVRQNGSKIMQSLAASIRVASCVSWAGSDSQNKTLTTYSDANCAADKRVDWYAFNITESRAVYKNDKRITSGAVAVCADTGCGSSCSTNGLAISGVPGTAGAVVLTLTIQQTPRANIRSDFCGRITLAETVTPRQY